MWLHRVKRHISYATQESRDDEKQPTEENHYAYNTTCSLRVNFYEFNHHFQKVRCSHFSSDERKVIHLKLNLCIYI